MRTLWRMFSYIEFPRALGRSEALVTRMCCSVIFLNITTHCARVSLILCHNKQISFLHLHLLQSTQSPQPTRTQKHLRVLRPTSTEALSPGYLGFVLIQGDLSFKSSFHSNRSEVSSNEPGSNRALNRAQAVVVMKILDAMTQRLNDFATCAYIDNSVA